MPQAGGTAASTNYTITPQDYQYLQAMLTHEGLSTITNDLKAGDTNSAYGQISGLVETWLNRAMSAGTGLQQQMLLPKQLTGFSAATVPQEAASLDPRISNMLDAYLQARAGGDSPVLPNVNQYLNTELVASNPKAFGTAYQKWYDASAMLGAFGDPRGGGSSSLQQEFLTNPNFGGTPDYSISLAPGLQLKPSEGDINAYADFRNNVRAYTPLPPSRPSDASLGLAPRSDAGPLDRFSDAVTGGLENAGNTIIGAFTNTLGRLPTAQEFQDRFGAIQSGASNVLSQLTDIASSPEAKSFSQATGIDPNQYVLNDIYRLGLGRGIDAPSSDQQMSVLRSQGAQSLYDQITNSQEGRTYALNNFYENNLNRGIDQAGLGKYLADLAAGKSMASVETSILQSPEAQSLGITPDLYSSIIGASSLTPTIGPNGLASPIGPGTAQGTVGPGATSSPLGFDGSTISPVSPGPDAGTLTPGPTQGTIDTAAPISPVGPEGSATSLVPAPEASQTVKDIYQTILARDPDIQGATDFTGQIQRGVPPSVVAAQVLNSPEAKTIAPDRYDSLVKGYQAKYGLMPEDAQTLGPLAGEFAQLVGRPADSQTVQHWDQQLSSGLPMSVIESQVIQAPEVQALGAPALSPLVQDYQTQYGLKPSEVATLSPLASEYAKLVGRPVDTPTLQHWDQQIDTGTPLGAVEAQVLMAPEVQALTGGQGDSFTAFQNRYGRSASDYLAGLTNPTGFSGANISGNVGNGTFDGTFNAANYLAANKDVAAAGVDPLTHYLTYGYNEGRALDTQGDRINQGFDPTAYLNANQDVKASGMDPLQHYLQFGAHEGRQPTFDATQPYSFSGANVSQGAGPTGNGGFGLNGITSSAPTPAASPALPQFGAGLNVSSGIMNGSFGINGIGTGGNAGAGISNPYGFSNANVGGALGATPQTFGSLYPAGDSPSSGSDVSSPFGFSGMNVSGFNPNASPAPAQAPSGNSGAVVTLNGSGFNPAASELSYLRGQQASLTQQTIAGQSPFATNPNLANASMLGAITPAQQAFGLAPIQIPVMPSGPILNPLVGGSTSFGFMHRGGVVPQRGLGGLARAEHVRRRAA